MQRSIRVLVCCALMSALAACVAPRPPHRRVPPPPPPPPVVRPVPNPPNVVPHEADMARYAQVEERIDSLHRRIDERVNQGYYPRPAGGSLHHRLDVIHQELHDMADQHEGGLSADEQRVLNQELDGATRAIGN
ncbi:hypothetical protein [Trinickia soli]|uniref:Lipoprotein n=1 Tax=Trinickia soli TaxID=380675 RepID=A0A2N7VWE7_9BURK|nr:hypothetical protein [Trinickia soli]KAA0083909.1 hypothetical protein CIW54_18975 [Paraburkholderia sp. T12-10]PMS21478.1 hypothetical protein C0Z19_18575 [Trinickia soli]CAB3698873.1 hypothetical protein LMG24076_03318 [Trinickia soli]